MASGSFPVTTKNQYISGKVEWSSVPNIAGNYSDVTATLRLSRTNTGYTTYGNGSFTMIINGDSKTNSGYFTFTYNSNTLCVSHTVRVYHNTDGTKSITITVYGSLPNTTLQMPSQSRTITLDTIPRASTIATFNNFTIGSNIPITINRASSNFTHTLELKYGSTSIATRTGIGASTTLVLTETELDRLYKAMANVTSGTVTLYCTTYSNGKKIGSTTSKTATATVGSNIRPDFTISHSEAVSDIKNQFGFYIQGKSRLSISINNAKAGRGASIKSYHISFLNVVYNSRTATTGFIQHSGSLPLEATVVDSRNRSTTKTVTINVSAYSPPQINNFRIDRCNSDGTLNPTGNYAKVQISGVCKSLNNKNEILLKISSKPRNEGSYTIKVTDSPDPNFTKEYVLGTYDTLKSYDFYAELIDYFERVTSSEVLGTAKVICDYGRTGLGVGKYHEQGDLDIGGDSYIDGELLRTGEYPKPLPLGSDWNGSLYYYKNALGQVTLYGYVETQAPYPGIIGQLPEGYRPVHHHACVFFDQWGQVRAGLRIYQDGLILLGDNVSGLHGEINVHTIFSTR